MQVLWRVPETNQEIMLQAREEAFKLQFVNLIAKQLILSYPELQLDSHIATIVFSAVVVCTLQLLLQNIAVTSGA